MEKKIIDKEMRIKLRSDFPQEAYSNHPTKTFLTTLKAMYVVERLNDVFGIGRWNLIHEIELKTDDYILLKGKLELLDYDCKIPQQFGGHKIVGKNTEIADGYKSAVTDILSKSASYLEIGIDMFKGKIILPKQNNYNQKSETTLQKEIKEKKEIKDWLAEEQFNKAFNSDIKGIDATLKAYDGQSGKGMKKEYRVKLNDKLNQLKS